MGERIDDFDRDSGGRAKAPPRRFAGAPRVRLETGSGALVEATAATTPAARLLGLALLAPEVAPPLLIPRCRSVHTFWMRAPIDVAFLALPRELAGPAQVLGLRPALPPRRLAALPRRASAGHGGARVAVLELAAGEAERLGIEPGTVLRCGPEQDRDRERAGGGHRDRD